MSFWNSPDLQPAKQNRFRIVFTPLGDLAKQQAELANSHAAAIRKEIEQEYAVQGGATTNAKIEAEVSKRIAKAVQSDYWWWAKSCTLPSFEIGMTDYQLVNHKFKYPGMLVWNDVTITLVDTSTRTEEIVNVLRLAGYGEGPSCGDGISKGSFNALGIFRIQLLDSNGIVKKSWKLEGWFYKAVRFGELNYESDDLMTIEMTLGYDFAVLEPAGATTDSSTVKQQATKGLPNNIGVFAAQNAGTGNKVRTLDADGNIIN